MLYDHFYPSFYAGEKSLIGFLKKAWVRYHRYDHDENIRLVVCGNLF